MRLRQRRWFPEQAEVSLRSEGSGPPVIAGYAAVFDSWTTLYRSPSYVVREVIRPGAFRNAIAEAQDVRALFNHHEDNVLGRTISGTLRLREDARGLHVEFEPPDTELGRSVTEMIRRGDVSQMSFAFIPRRGGEKTTTRQDGDAQVSEIEITDVDLFDVAPVTYPAYQDTEVAVRRADVVRRLKEGRLEHLQRRIDQAAGRLKKV